MADPRHHALLGALPAERQRSRLAQRRHRMSPKILGAVRHRPLAPIGGHGCARRGDPRDPRWLIRLGFQGRAAPPG
ncbi:MAG: hypothetical protein MZV49_12330 [Rhodopseudomonas palustris]|nr:hypothetical protein [Rhodopseudomonas palustris]